MSTALIAPVVIDAREMALVADVAGVVLLDTGDARLTAAEAAALFGLRTPESFLAALSAREPARTVSVLDLDLLGDAPETDARYDAEQQAATTAYALFAVLRTAWLAQSGVAVVPSVADTVEAV
jgi:hypothetical protein